MVMALQAHFTPQKVCKDNHGQKTIQACSLMSASVHHGKKRQLEPEAIVFLGAKHSCGIIVTYWGRSALDQRDKTWLPYSDGGICIPGCISIQDLLMRYTQMDVWLLHMGERYMLADCIAPLGVWSQVVMVCIGSIENLHKMGVMNMDPVFCASVFQEDDMMSYALGGLDMLGFRRMLDSVLMNLPFGNKESSSCRTCGGGGEWSHRCFRQAFATAWSPSPVYKPTRADRPMALCCMAYGRHHQNYKFHKFLSQL
ncbi:hypothetical protein L7F22_022917 [Adiantum nelumboides]|nr:hypothetical protein [Adiantum nelumboides]